MRLFSRRALFRLTLAWFAVTPILYGVVHFCDRFVERAASGRCFDNLTACPEVPVALVLGCAPQVAGDRPNRYFTARMDAAALLFHSGKCRYLLVSGDNGRIGYDEPTAMRDALVSRGVPESAIVRDHAGFDTLDSVLRARKVFDLKAFLVVSQAFHNERAICIARHHGIEVHGWNAVDVQGAYGIKTHFREKLARVKTMLDIHLWRSGPKYLGPQLAIGEAKP
jgi:SanA protein